MPDKLKITLYILLGVVAAIALFSLIVVVSCSVNGLTFGEQICAWFSGGKLPNIPAEQLADAIAQTPIA